MAVRRRSDQSGERIEIDTRYAAERWRYICPMGHIDWRVTPEGFVCHACKEHAPVGDGGSESRDAEDEAEDGRFPALLDRRTRQRIPRERISVVETAVGAAYETAGSETGRSADTKSPHVGTDLDS